MIDNWQNGTGEYVWKNGTNELCWRDANWTPATAAVGCDGALVQAAPAAPAPVAVAAAPRPAPVVAAAQPRQAPVAAAPASRPARPAPAAAAEEPAAAKPPKPAKGGKGGEVDDETKKAIHFDVATDLELITHLPSPTLAQSISKFAPRPHERSTFSLGQVSVPGVHEPAPVTMQAAAGSIDVS